MGSVVGDGDRVRQCTCGPVCSDGLAVRVELVQLGGAAGVVGVALVGLRLLHVFVPVWGLGLCAQCIALVGVQSGGLDVGRGAAILRALLGVLMVLQLRVDLGQRRLDTTAVWEPKHREKKKGTESRNQRS